MYSLEKNIPDNKAELKIPPVEIGGELVKVPLADLKSGIQPTVEIKKAIVSYVDVLGFANKIEVKDIENVLLDFSGSLTSTAHEFPEIRFNLFSDNAFLATSQDNAKDLISALRYAFGRWAWKVFRKMFAVVYLCTFRSYRTNPINCIRIPLYFCNFSLNFRIG